ncbi:MAG: hypothetical protein C0476_00345 [Sphingomonas sp.]|nr:hypothetical protein [Sphingomonas sp.]
MWSILTRDTNARRVRIATAVDVDALGAIGPAAYAQAYGDWWADAAALAEHARSFEAPAFGSLLADPQVTVWVAERAGSPVGFLTMHRGERDPVTARANGVELRRIYLLQAATGSGLGRMLATAAIDLARSEGHDHAWLDVMAQAGWAVSAYRRWGFAEIGRKMFENKLRGDLREMIVMSRDI